MSHLHRGQTESFSYLGNLLGSVPAKDFSGRLKKQKLAICLRLSHNRKHKQRQRRRQRKRHLKLLLHFISLLVVLLRDFFNSCNLTQTANIPETKLVGVARFEFKKKENAEKFTVVSGIAFHKTLNLVLPLCCFAEDGKEMY